MLYSTYYILFVNVSIFPFSLSISSEPLRLLYFLLVLPYGILVLALEKHRLSFDSQPGTHHHHPHKKRKEKYRVSKQLVKEISPREKGSSSPWPPEEQKPHCGVKLSFCHYQQRRCVGHLTAKNAARYPLASKKSVFLICHIT